MTEAGAPVPITAAEVAAYRVPTEAPESDGTLEWTATTLLTVHLEAGGVRGFGYGWGSRAAAAIVADRLLPVIDGMDALHIPRAWEAMRVATRNDGHPGVVFTAIGAVDIALWDLKARLLGVSCAGLMGARLDAVPLYGSGGFTSYDLDRLRDQLGRWVHEDGLRRVKMKVGREPDRDAERVRAARDAIGDDAELFVDANGACTVPQAIAMAEAFADSGVTWFEEPVSSDDVAGLRRIRERAPAGMQITAGEYAATLFDFRRFCEHEAVDVLQPDTVRCGGFTGFLRAAALCDAFSVPISAHTAPQLDAHVCAAAPGVLHAEWFHDQVRIGRMFFDGFLEPRDGALRFDPSRPGLGLDFRAADAEHYRVA